MTAPILLVLRVFSQKRFRATGIKRAARRGMREIPPQKQTRNREPCNRVLKFRMLLSRPLGTS
jgi:hypothetical protein